MLRNDKANLAGPVESIEGPRLVLGMLLGAQNAKETSGMIPAIEKLDNEIVSLTDDKPLQSLFAKFKGRFHNFFLLTFFRARSFYLRFLYPKFFVSKIFLDPNFFGLKFFFNHNFLDLNFLGLFFYPFFFWIQHFGPNLFGHRFFGPKNIFP